MDDLICVPSSKAINEEFGRRLHAFFGKDSVTGGEQADYILGMKLERTGKRGH